MIKFVFLMLVFNSVFVFSQTKKDSILVELRNKTAKSGITFKRNTDSIEKVVYILCEKWADEVSFLKSTLTDSEIEELKAENNASMNMIGLITELEKNNTKEYAIGMVNDLIEIDGKYIDYRCSDAILIKPISSVLLYLLTSNNFFFKADFNLKKEEIIQLENKILTTERNRLLKN